MSKILVVKYTPRNGSNTEKLLDIGLSVIASKKLDFKLLDLEETPPEFLLSPLLNAYYDRSYKKLEISERQSEHLEKMNFFSSQLQEADKLIMAFPIYNFGMPGIIKSWIDLVVEESKAFRETDYGPEPLYKNKQALVISTSGSTKLDSPSDFMSPHLKRIFSFAGFKAVNFSGAYGIKYTGLTDSHIASVKNDVETFLND